ncbi:MAG TPA: hypothetical protein PK018_06725 [Candidatus Competibacter sp.]|nr:hypothetical protein [Candidatus Competibacteraceae bacterium]HPE71850.1 hypothetical protein [Candidatus Competibacter sp.]HRW65856.1 hypothetical protein [Candidatus Competibacter sp.]
MPFTPEKPRYLLYVFVFKNLVFVQSLTWQVLAGIGYRFDWGDVSLAYRYLKWDLGSSSPIDDIGFSGPHLTATFRF